MIFSQSMQFIFKGCYQDIQTDTHGNWFWKRNWRLNTIVNTAWPLVAGLLKNDPDMSGILYWAVGAGDPAWDQNPITANPAADGLHTELSRQVIDAAQIAYLNPDGTPSEIPTNSIEASAVFNWEADQTLREFGLFGGNASAEINSGYMINYVVHPRLDLAAGSNLFRRVRFTLRPDLTAPQLEIPSHWLGKEPVRIIDGIGRVYAQILENAETATLEDLAMIEATSFGETLPLMRVVELRAKARLAVRTASDVQPIAGLAHYSLREILTTPSETLITESGANAAEINRLKEQAGALQLTLDNNYIRQVTIGQLAQVN